MIEIRGYKISSLNLVLGGLTLLGLGVASGYLGSRLINGNIKQPGQIGINLENLDHDNQLERIYLCFDRDADGKFDRTKMFEWQYSSEKKYDGECEKNAPVSGNYKSSSTF